MIKFANEYLREFFKDIINTTRFIKSASYHYALCIGFSLILVRASLIRADFFYRIYFLYAWKYILRISSMYVYSSNWKGRILVYCIICP